MGSYFKKYRIFILNLVFFFGLFCYQFLFAYETDNFTKRYEPLLDSASVLDQEVNRLLQVALIKVNNSTQVKCDDSELINAVKSELVSSWLSGIIEGFIDDNPHLIPQHRIPLLESIYSHKSLFDTILKPVGLRPSIRLCGVYLGADKLGHFFDQGWSYFKVYRESESLQKALQVGEKQEQTYFGKGLTGIKSFADLVANYQGLQFWLQVSGKQVPYFSCEKGHWKQERDFHWKDYVNDAWDEAVNCSEYSSPKYARAVYLKQYELEKSNPSHRRYICPVDRIRCRQLRSELGKKLEGILSPLCY